VTVELTDTMDVAKMLFRRQLNTDNNDNDDDDGNDVDDGVWWYSPVCIPGWPQWSGRD
jgi:hypothetical protein